MKCRIDLFTSPSTIKPVSIEAGTDGKLSQSMLTVGGGGGGGGGASQSNCRLIFFLPSVLIQLDLFAYFLAEMTEHKTF